MILGRFKNNSSKIISSILGFFFLISAPLFSTLTWTPIQNIPGANFTNSNFISSYAPYNGGVTFVSWSNTFGLGGQPFFSLFNGSWTTSAAIPGSVTVSSDVFSSYNATLGKTIVTWIDSATLNPFFAAFDGTTWVGPAAISSNMANIVSAVLPTSYNPLMGFTFVAWRDANFGGLPFYSIYNGSSWSPAVPIPGAGTAEGAVFSSYNSAIGETVVTWVDIATSMPFFATFNGTIWTQLATQMVSTRAENTVTTSYNPLLGETLALWQDNTDSLLLYSVYNGTTWTNALQIPGSGFTPFLILSSYDPVLGQTIVTWTDNTISGEAVFSTYSGSWSPPAPITTMLLPISAVYTSFNPILSDMMATFRLAQGGQFNVYSLLNTPLTAASELMGTQKNNNFAVVNEYYNILTWQAGHVADLVSYSLFRNGTLIATLDPTVSSYEDHNRSRNHADTYLLVSNFVNGTTLSSTVTVGGSS